MGTLALLSGCAESREAQHDDATSTEQDSGTVDTGDTVDTASDDTGTGSLSTSTGDDTGTSGTVDAPDTSTFETDPYEHGLACDDPLTAELEGKAFELLELWSRFPSDDFDGSRQGCAQGTGPALWIAVEVPAGQLLTVERTEGVQVAFSLQADCDAESCLASGFGALSYRNETTSAQGLLVAVEATAPMPMSLVGLRLRVIDETGETCDEALPLTGPFPQTETLSFADFLYNDEDSSCGWAFGPDFWLNLAIPAASVATLTIETAAALELGYAKSCDECEDYGTDPSLEYVNASDEPTSLLAIVRAENEFPLFPDLELTLDIAPLPAGDTCSTALTASSLPYTFSAGSTVWHHTCEAEVCDGALGPDAWIAVQVPSSAVLSVRKTAGPGARLIVVEDCDLAAPSASTGAELLEWSNNSGATATVQVAVVALTASSLAGLALTVDTRLPAAGDTCGMPIVVGPSETALAGDFEDRTNLFEPGALCAAASGPEVWYSIDVPAGHSFSVKDDSKAKVSLQLLETCDAGACLASAVDGAQAGYLNGSDHTVALRLAVEASAAAPGDEPYEIELAIEPIGPGAVCSTAIAVDAATAEWTGDWAAQFSHWSPDDHEGCVVAHGREVFLAVTVGPQEQLTIEERFYPIATVVHILDGCDSDAACLTSGAERAVYYNPADEPVEIVVVIEAADVGVSGGPIELELQRRPIEEGDACSEAEALGPEVLPASFIVNMWELDRAWRGGACGTSLGSDYWMSALVPAGYVMLLAETTAADAVTTVASGCPMSSCLASSSGGERIAYFNDSGDDQTLLAVLRAETLAASASQMQAEIDVFEPDEAEVCGKPRQIEQAELPAVLDLSVGGWHDTFNGAAADGCEDAAVDSQAWLSVEVPAGQYLLAQSDAGFLHVLESCETTVCAASGQGLVLWRNEAKVAANVLLVAEPTLGDDLRVSVEVTDSPEGILGPDAFGYIGLIDNNLSRCPDISATGALLPDMEDESIVEVDLGFDFRFYGQTRDTLWVATNGIVVLEPVTFVSTGYDIPSSSLDAAFIAPFWDDLDVDATKDARGVFYAVLGTAPQRTAHLQWEVVPYTFNGTAEPISFSVVLEEANGSVHLCYRDTVAGNSLYDYGAGASVGLQGSAEAGLSVSYLEPFVDDGMHVRFVAP